MSRAERRETGSKLMRGVLALLFVCIPASGCGGGSWTCETHDTVSGPRCNCDNDRGPLGSLTACPAQLTCCRAFELVATGVESCSCDQKDADRCQLSIESIRANQFTRDARRVSSCPPP